MGGFCDLDNACVGWFVATQLLPKEVVDQLDRYIIGQNDAKKAVAIAFRTCSRYECRRSDSFDVDACLL